MILPSLFDTPRATSSTGPVIPFIIVQTLKEIRFAVIKPSEGRVQVIRNSRKHRLYRFWVPWRHSVSYVIKLINQVPFEEVRPAVAVTERCVNVVGYARPSLGDVSGMVNLVCIVVEFVVFVSFEEVGVPVVWPQKHLIDIVRHSIPGAQWLRVVLICAILYIVEAPIHVAFKRISPAVHCPRLNCVKTGFTLTCMEQVEQIWERDRRWGRLDP